jgi:penicillin-binding protein 1B
LGQYGRFEVHGFQRAARFYFDKEIGKLSLEGLATLVALIKGQKTKRIKISRK